MPNKRLLEEAKAVLAANDRGGWTQPAHGLYPHQWLWDSCFISIGLARYDTSRAITEIRSLLKGQWSNGMVPHMIFTSKSKYGAGPTFWQSSRSPYAPKDVATSGITQPPLLAEACWRIAQRLPENQAVSFLREVYPAIVAYHGWLYQERDIDSNGLVALYHPWETGLDNAPKWMEELDRVHTPLWIRTAHWLRLEGLLGVLLRQDLKYVLSDERIATRDALRLTHIALGLRKRNYDNARIIKKPHFVTESLSFNSLFAGANRRLEEIADRLGETLPEQLVKNMQLTRQSLDALWSTTHGQFMHRTLVNGELVRVEGIAKLLPLYAGCISEAHAIQVVNTLRDRDKFWLRYPVPSVPKDSAYFNPRRYWQGPTWINTNWLIIQGLRNYGFWAEADELKHRTLELISRSGFYEYFDPLDGSAAGVGNFSWTAALYIDLASE